jgi:hypothetical protein
MPLHFPLGQMHGVREWAARAPEWTGLGVPLSGDLVRVDCLLTAYPSGRRSVSRLGISPFTRANLTLFGSLARRSATVANDRTD